MQRNMDHEVGRLEGPCFYWAQSDFAPAPKEVLHREEVPSSRAVLVHHVPVEVYGGAPLVCQQHLLLAARNERRPVRLGKQQAGALERVDRFFELGRRHQEVYVGIPAGGVPVAQLGEGGPLQDGPVDAGAVEGTTDGPQHGQACHVGGGVAPGRSDQAGAGLWLQEGSEALGGWPCHALGYGQRDQLVLVAASDQAFEVAGPVSGVGLLARGA
jgi:hypothetical protein